ncbi:protein FAM83A-like [Siniperca chuatsi]|uniref:protein FAM83A-like n=1 Tax=Siniperca chuatsi TaxID=119488 RepID=UPI001CE0E346|nr:protein FAM83A-like [Siniperca chuatsi]
MDASSVSVLWYRRSKPLGKVRRRVQDLRIPSSSSSYCDFIASRPTLDLSHNESARLAADSLLSQGLEAYHEVLNAEGEVDFLSELEKIYILENGRDGSTADPGASDDDDKELESLSPGYQSATRCPAMSTDSDPTVAGLDLSSLKVKWTDPVLDEPNVEVYFQSQSMAAGTKDLVREFIRKARMVLAIVMDSFSDVELLCDLLEASRKRNVSVYLLLDHLNLNLFVRMWQDLKLDSKNFPKLSVRSVDGQTYCAKTGRKLTGQIAESFIVTDWIEVLTGSYSFSWLSWQVHRSLAVLVKGSAVIPFHQEFHRLYSSSKPVPGFATYITVPSTLPLYNTLHAAQNDNADVSKSKSNQTKTMCHRVQDEDAQNTQTKAKMPVLSNPQSAELECSKGNTQPLHRAGTGTQMHGKPPQLYPKPLVQPGALQSVSVGKPKYTVGAVCTQYDAQSNVELLEKNQNHIQSHANPLSQTHVSHAQSQLTSLTINNTAEKNARVQESNPLHTASPAHGQHTTVHYQSPFQTNSNLEHHTEGLFFQQWNRDMLAKPSGIAVGLNTQRRQWNCSLNFKPNVDFLSCLVLSPSTSQQKQVVTSLQFPLTHPREHTSGLQTKVTQGTRGQDQPQRHHQPPLQSHPTTEAPGSKSALTAMGSPLKPHLQPDSKLFLTGTGPKLHLQPHTYQQVKPPPRLNWMPQNHAARPRPVARHNSFTTTYGTGQNTGRQVGWRPFQSSMNTSLGRSKSMTDRTSAGFKGAGLNPNITRT